MSEDAWGKCIYCSRTVFTNEKLANIKDVAHYECEARFRAEIDAKLMAAKGGCKTCGGTWTHFPECPAGRFLGNIR